MDVLSDFLDASGLRGQIFLQTCAAAPWGVAMPALPQVGLHVVTRGTCWLLMTGEPQEGRPVERRRLFPGDAILLPHGSGHGLADDPASPLVSLDTWKATRDERHQLVEEVGEDGDTTHLICGAYRFVSGSRHPLVSQLPPVIHLRADSTSPGLDRALRSLRAEFESPSVGSPTLVSRLLDVVFVEALRTWLAEEDKGNIGWLSALRDRPIADALAHLHREPQRRWTVEDLGREVALSRAVLARRFRHKVGVPPLTYLTQLRMDLAARLIRRGDVSLAEIATQVGYDSEHAFHRAFKRAFGQPPGQYREQNQG
ncbi:MAG: AraC family transcriptional regulator [Acidobacteriota bacterium]